MKRTFYVVTLGFLAAAFFTAIPVYAQKKAAAVKPVIFAVWNDGKWIDPIAVVSNGKLAAAPEDETELKAFGSRYYKPGSSYSLIFGGAADGSATVVKSNIGSECGGPSADVMLKSTKVKPAGLVMALASNIKLKPEVSGYRRRPTPDERTEIEKLVRNQFTKNGAPAETVKLLRFQNFTAVDIEADGTADFIGSYWIAPTSTERRLLFFIAEQKSLGDIKIAYSEHSVVKSDEIMSGGDLKDLDDGRGAEVLVDLLDYDNDGVREVFTIGQAYEGNNYYVYKRANGKWTRVLETYNYRCAF